MKISIIVPTYNEAEIIRQPLQRFSLGSGAFEIIFVDGGSSDDTVQIIRESKNPSIKIISATPSQRARQMNAAAREANGDILLFLHADCELPAIALSRIQEALQDARIIGGGFYKKYTEESLFLTIYRITNNLIRTKFFGNLVGTNALFIRRTIFFELGGYPEVPILEDVMLCDLMKSRGKLIFLKPHVISSSRRYLKSGILRRMTIALKIIFLYRVRKWPAEKLKKIYQQSIK